MSNYLSGNKYKILFHASSTPTATEQANNIVIPRLDGLHISLETIANENSGRDLSGNMHITWVKTDLRKLEIELPPCSYAEVARVRSIALARKAYVTYIDPYTNTERTTHYYNSGGSADVYSGVVHNGLITGFSFSVIDIG